MKLLYIPDGCVHHVLEGIKSLTTQANKWSITRAQIETWTRITPCRAETVMLQAVLDQLCADGHIEVTVTGDTGLSAQEKAQAQQKILIRLLASGRFMLGLLNAQRKNAPKPAGTVSGRKQPIHGVESPLQHPPAMRRGADDFLAVPSLTRSGHRAYDQAQGMGRAQQ